MGETVTARQLSGDVQRTADTAPTGDTAVPMLFSGTLTDTLEFYAALGYTVAHQQTRPYAYGAVTGYGCALHFSAGARLTEEEGEQVACLVMIEDAAGRHRGFTAALRAYYGKIPVRGRPRITRFRPGQTRFTVVDPAGNSVIYIQRDEPQVEYGGSQDLEGLAKVLDNARILRDFKTDDRTAFRVLEVGLGRYGAEAPTVDRARALAALTELAAVLGESDQARRYRAALTAIQLTEEQRAAVASELRASADLEGWFGEQP